MKNLPRDIINRTSPDEFDSAELLRKLTSSKSPTLNSPLDGTFMQRSLLAYAEHLKVNHRSLDSLVSTVLMAYDLVLRSSIAQALNKGGFPVDAKGITQEMLDSVADKMDGPAPERVDVKSRPEPLPVVKEVKPSQFSATLKYAQEKFASTPAEKKALDRILSRVRELEHGANGRRKSKNAQG